MKPDFNSPASIAWKQVLADVEAIRVRENGYVGKPKVAAEIDKLYMDYKRKYHK